MAQSASRAVGAAEASAVCIVWQWHLLGHLAQVGHLGFDTHTAAHISHSSKGVYGRHVKSQVPKCGNPVQSPVTTGGMVRKMPLKGKIMAQSGGKPILTKPN